MSSSEATTNGGQNDKDITDPRDTDVLCGRGGAALRHPGNQTYRRLVNLNKGLYITCLKTEKLKISRSIVAAIREQNGRFLEKDAAKGSWYDIGDKKAIEKTSQALREGQPKLRQKIVEMGGGAQGTAALMEQQFGANGIYAQNAAAAAQSPHSLQQSQNSMRGYDPSLQMGGGMSSPGMMAPHQTMASALAAAGRNPSHLSQQQQQQQHQQHGSYQHHQQQQQRMQHNVHPEMPPPQARQALHTEMMRLSMHGNDDEEPPLRPSAVKRGSAAAQEMAYMPEYSGGVGNSNHVASSMYGMEAASGRKSFEKLGSSHNNAPRDHHYMDPYGPSSASGFNNPYNQDVDRRRVFARMKYARQGSDRNSSRQIGTASAHSIGDGMPDFHMVESSLSLYSNLSGMAGNDSNRPADGEAKRPSNDMLGGAGSRHSIMSGLSRISDTSEVHSIFSDLSRKIGNVSTRSIAMSEISGIDEYRGGDDSDSTPSFGEAEPRTTQSGGGGMDFDVL